MPPVRPSYGGREKDPPSRRMTKGPELADRDGPTEQIEATTGGSISSRLQPQERRKNA
jgi:hypothetical protein